MVVLDPAKALFLCGGADCAIDKKARRAVMVVGRYSEDVHGLRSMANSRLMAWARMKHPCAVKWQESWNTSTLAPAVDRISSASMAAPPLSRTAATTDLIAAR